MGAKNSKASKKSKLNVGLNVGLNVDPKLNVGLNVGLKDDSDRGLDLNQIDFGQVSNVPNKNIITECRIIKVYDGDTINIGFLIDNTTPFICSLRLDGIDAPEITLKNGTSKTEKETGLMVRDYIVQLLKDQPTYCILTKNDKYGGRILGDILYGKKQINLSKHLLELGMVKEYHGQKKEKWTNSELNAIKRKIK